MHFRTKDNYDLFDTLYEQAYSIIKNTKIQEDHLKEHVSKTMSFVTKEHIHGSNEHITIVCDKLMELIQ